MGNSDNQVRTEIRNTARANDSVLSSLQSCKLSENRNILESQLSKLNDPNRRDTISSLIYILDSLLARVPDDVGWPKVESYMNFEEGYEIYVSFRNKSDLVATTPASRLKKQHFQNRLLHPTSGLCFYIVNIFGVRYIVL